MNLLIIGCEWAGKRTLGDKIAKWWSEKTGSEYSPPPSGIHFHDHYTVPHVVHIGGHDHHKEQSEKDILKLNPGVLEHFQRYQIEYHFQPSFIEEGNHWNIDWYYADAVYAPVYWGFGGEGEYAARREARVHWDQRVVEAMPDTILVLIKATPATIKQRKKDGVSPYPSRHANTMFKSKDAKLIIDLFQEEFDNSLIRQRFSIDTTNSTPDESLDEFIKKATPYLTHEDRTKISMD